MKQETVLDVKYMLRVNRTISKRNILSILYLYCCKIDYLLRFLTTDTVDYQRDMRYILVTTYQNISRLNSFDSNQTAESQYNRKDPRNPCSDLRAPESVLGVLYSGRFLFQKIATRRYQGTALVV